MTNEDRRSLGIGLRIPSWYSMAGMFVYVKAVSKGVPLA